jgi:Tol biopolymer transport system component
MAPGDPLRSEAAATPDPDDRLDSWKEIAAYLRREVTTVQRWEKQEGLPVHRLHHQKLGSVYASKRELDAWRDRDLSHANVAAAGRRWLLMLVATVLVASSAVFVNRERILRRAARFREGAASASLARTDVAAEVQPLTSDFGDEAEPALSPDANYVAFVWNREGSRGRHDLYVKQIVGGEPVRIATCTPPEDCYGPDWSPDGQYVAFLRRAPGEPLDGRAGVFLIPALGGPERRVGSALVSSGGISWFPDGRTIAVTTEDHGSRNRRIALLSLETANLHPFSDPPAGTFDTRPAVSPDGRTVAFLRRRIDWPFSTLLTQTADATQPPRSSGFGDREISDFGWSPDSSAVFAASEGSLFRVQLDGGKVGRVAVDGRVGRVSVSRTRNRLALVSSTPNSDLWRVRGPAAVERTAPERANISSTRDDTRPLYSPDGRHVAFVTKRRGAAELWTCGPDGEDCGPVPVPMRFAGQDRPAWSSDSRQILFEAARPGERNASFYVFDFSSRTLRVLGECPPNSRNAVWATDGSHIYFSPDDALQSGVWTVPIDGSARPRPTVNEPGMIAVAESEGYLYLARFEGPVGTVLTATMWRLSLRSGRKEQIPGRVWGRYAVWKGRIVAVRQHDNDEGSSIVLIDPGANRTEKLADVDAVASQPTVSPDGRWILFAATIPQRDLLLVEVKP